MQTFIELFVINQ